MFNVSLKLREQTGLVSPLGPSFSSAPEVRLEIEGVQVYIKLPRRRTALPIKDKAVASPCFLKDLPLHVYEKNGVALHGEGILSRHWDFYGPWFTGDMGGINFIGSIISPKNKNTALNYFHPRAFELGVTELLTHDYGGEFSVINFNQLWHGPINFRQQIDAPCVAARFEVVRQSAPHIGPHYFLVFPLDKSHLLVFVCEVNRPGVFPIDDPKLTADDWIDLKPFTTLANQVLDSVQIKLSPEAKAAQQEALQGLSEADRQLVKDFLPLKWTKENADLIQAS